MPHKKTGLFGCLIFTTLLVAIISCAKAGTENFTVPPEQEVVRTVWLNKGDKVSGSITVSGGTHSNIAFYVSDPHKNTILRYDKAKQQNFSFTASTTGTHAMHFDNSPSAYSVYSSKSVTLSNTISRVLFGLAPELFSLLLLIFATAIVIGAIVVAYAYKWRKPAIHPSSSMHAFLSCPKRHPFTINPSSFFFHRYYLHTCTKSINLIISP